MGPIPRRRFTALAMAGLFFQVSSARAASPGWSEKMQALRETLTDLLPRVAASGTEKDPELEKAAKRLAGLAHKLDVQAMGKTGAPDADPSLRFFSATFERETKVAYQALQGGHVGYAKNVLKNIAGYCITCHTRNTVGPSFPAMEMGPRIEKLTRLEKAELFAAMRQFDPALVEFEAVLADAKTAREEPFQWGKASRHALAIAVRVKRDPERALAILKTMDGSDSVPAFFKGYVAPWRQSVEAWKKEGTKPRSESPKALLAEANRLIQEARKVTKHPVDHSGDIYFLRASTVVHDLLGVAPRGELSGEALLLAGQTYDALNDVYVSRVPEMYYEACVRENAHTAVAKKCYDRYEENIYFGYTGSAGTFIPLDIRERMAELRKLAAGK